MVLTKREALAAAKAELEDAIKKAGSAEGELADIDSRLEQARADQGETGQEKTE